MRRSTTAFASTSFVGGWLLFAGFAAAADLDGRHLYLKHCAACHGIEARGDGPDAKIFAEEPRDLREGFLKKYSTDDLVRRIRDGAPLELALDLPALRARSQDVNALVSYLKRLPEIDWKVTAKGWGIYIDRCEICHGVYGTPTKDLPPGVRPPGNLSDPTFQRLLSDKELLDAVRHGRKGMPALTPRVPETAAKPLTAFVRLLSPGFQTYSSYCANCHGDDGRGVPDYVSSPETPTVPFDRRYFVRRDPDQLHVAVWHMLAEQKPAMPHYRWNINEADARAIVEYLKRSN